MMISGYNNNDCGYGLEARTPLTEKPGRTDTADDQCIDRLVYAITQAVRGWSMQCSCQPEQQWQTVTLSAV
jgi:hypothetical protein